MSITLSRAGTVPRLWMPGSNISVVLLCTLRKDNKGNTALCIFVVYDLYVFRTDPIKAEAASSAFNQVSKGLNKQVLSAIYFSLRPQPIFLCFKKVFLGVSSSFQGSQRSLILLTETVFSCLMSFP